MTLIYIGISSISIIIGRLLKNINKQIYLISTIMISIPTLYDWSEIDVYYTTDGISDILILLTIYILPISIISNWNNIKDNIYYELLLNLGIILLINFMCQDMTSFYIYFEISLAPLFIIIALYGSINKNKASDYILIYTLFSSLFMLLSIGLYEIIIDNTDYQSTSLLVLSLDLQSILFIGLSIGIAVKIPLLPVHTWLPIVHSESPLGGSIILAGIILKLSIYAIIRLLLPTLSDACLLYTPFIYIISIITIIYTSIITLRQIDLKVIIAYSSISHMAISVLGIFSNTLIGINGSLLLCIAHGFVSPALFIIVGGILYDRYHNRLIYYYNGLITFMPYLSVLFIILSFCNIGTPLSLNFLGELFSITGALNNNPYLASLAALSVLLSASYQLKLTNRLTGGIKTPYINYTSDLTFRESTLLWSLTLPTLFFGLFPNFLLNLLWNSYNLLYIFIVLFLNITFLFITFY